MKKSDIKYILIAALNLADYTMTAYWTDLHGIQTEINPIMRLALSTPGAFAVVKLVLFPILLLWMRRKRCNDSAWFTLGAFAAVTVLNCSTVFGL